MRKHVVPIVLAVLAFVAGGVTACGTTENVKSVTSAPPASSAPANAPASTPSAPAKSSVKIATWGETFTYDNGLQLSVAQPTDYKPTEFAAGGEGFTKFVVVEVTIKNGTSDAFSPALMTVNCSSGGKAGDALFDGEVGGAEMSAADLLPGQSLTFKAAFGVENEQDITFDIRPSFEYKSSYFQGSAK